MWYSLPDSNHNTIDDRKGKRNKGAKPENIIPDELEALEIATKPKK